MPETKFGWYGPDGNLDLWGETHGVYFATVLNRRLWDTGSIFTGRRIAFFENAQLRDELSGALKVLGVEAIDNAYQDTIYAATKFKNIRTTCIADCPCGTAYVPGQADQHNVNMDFGDSSVPLPVPGGAYSRGNIARLIRAGLDNQLEAEDILDGLSTLEKELSDGATAAAKLGYRIVFMFSEDKAGVFVTDTFSDDKGSITATDAVITIGLTGSYDNNSRVVAGLDTILQEVSDDVVAEIDVVQTESFTVSLTRADIAALTEATETGETWEDVIKGYNPPLDVPDLVDNGTRTNSDWEVVATRTV